MKEYADKVLTQHWCNKMTANSTEARLCKWTLFVFGKLCFHFFNKYSMFLYCEKSLSFVFSVSEASYYVSTYSSAAVYSSQRELCEPLPSYCSVILVFGFHPLRLLLQTVSANKVFDLVISFLQQPNPSNPVQAERRCSNATVLRTAWFRTKPDRQTVKEAWWFTAGLNAQLFLHRNGCISCVQVCQTRYQKKFLQKALPSQLKPFTSSQIQLACS